MSENREPQITVIKEYSDFCFGCGQPKNINRKAKQPCKSTIDGRHTYIRRSEVDLQKMFGGAS